MALVCVDAWSQMAFAVPEEALIGDCAAAGCACMVYSLPHWTFPEDAWEDQGDACAPPTVHSNQKASPGCKENPVRMARQQTALRVEEDIDRSNRP
jgi:hypothetical protein